MDEDLKVIKAIVKTFNDMDAEAIERIVAYLGTYAMQRTSKEFERSVCNDDEDLFQNYCNIALLLQMSYFNMTVLPEPVYEGLNEEEMYNV